MGPQDVKHWKEFEDFVAQIYRVIGGSRVRQNVNLAGNQIDLYLEEETPSGQVVRTAVECKYYSTPVPKSAVLQFGTVAQFLRQAGLIDKALMVAYKGYTREAQTTAKAANIETWSFQDLEARVNPEIFGPRVVAKVPTGLPLPDQFPKLAFVVMPFAETLEDTYLYGIRRACSATGLECKRGDEIQHGNVVIEEVLDHIKRARVTIAELSDHNPNVFYEVGWAHALSRPTVLVARKGTALPFDVRHINTLFYTNIKDLEVKLAARLRSIMSQGNNE
ncbi:MAG: restriction endonuclease [Chloroflexi bacterium]|nr:restriction endonuclease [Chloroflexota bacterium]